MAVGLGWKQTEHESGSQAVWALNLELLVGGTEAWLLPSRACYRRGQGEALRKCSMNA